MCPSLFFFTMYLESDIGWGITTKEVLTEAMTSFVDVQMLAGLGKLHGEVCLWGVVDDGEVLVSGAIIDIVTQFMHSFYQ